MAATSISFFIFSMAILVTLSVVLVFWFYLLIAFAAVIVVMGVIEYYQYARWGLFRVGLRRRVEPDFSSRIENTTERKIRDKIQREWDKQSGFGNSEDLR